MNRRTVLSCLARAAALSPFHTLSLTACSDSPVSPDSPGGAPLRLNVRDFGAAGNGVVDDAKAFAAAIGALGPQGGTVAVPDGTYLVDPRQSIVLASRVALALSPGAVLQAMAVPDGVSAVVLIRDVTNVRITGGTVVGERYRHLGTTGEWGMGISIRGGSDITVEDVTVRECWGDGIYVGSGSSGEAQRVLIRGCRSMDNRRQGLSMTACVASVVENSEFRGTRGTAPQSGIDLEPNAPYEVRDITIRDCHVAQNAGYGIVLSGVAVTNVTLEGNRCVENAYDGGIALLRASDCAIRSNTVERNSRNGIQLEQASRNLVSANTVRQNSQAQPLRWSNVAIVSKSASNLVSENLFVDPNSSVVSGPRFDVTIAADCDDNRIIGNRLRPREVDAQRLPVGGIHNENPTTIVADNT